jgi:phytoene dehydrogenase-like protein
MVTRDVDVAIVGSGLTGLRAAQEVSKNGLSVILLESASDVGGRIRTTPVKGALLDHGFQVLLTGYPELASAIDLSQLKLGLFSASAKIRINSAWRHFFDPRRHPLQFMRSLASPVASPSDLIRFGILSQKARFKGSTLSGVSTEELIDSWRFSRRFADGFIKPFLRGVLLDPRLSIDSALALFYLNTFSKAGVGLPAGGMQALPNLMAERLGREHILVNQRVLCATKNRVTLESGEDISARQVIVACGALEAAALGGPEQTIPHCSVTTLYFIADNPPFPEASLVLNGDGVPPINHLAVLSNAQPSYAPHGKALISASVIGSCAELPEGELAVAVRKQLSEWFGMQVRGWEFIRSFCIRAAIPARPRGLSAGWVEKLGVLYAGDYLSYGSQNGALQAGRMVGEEVSGRLLG